MGKTTRMAYQLHLDGMCVENMCGTLKRAKHMARELKEKLPKKLVEVYRVDRSGHSDDYFELMYKL